MTVRAGTVRGSSVSIHNSCGRLKHTVNLCKVVPSVPVHLGGKEPDALVDPAPSAKLRSVRVQHDLVRACLLDTHSEVGVAVLYHVRSLFTRSPLYSESITYGSVEVEDPKQASALEYNHLVALILQADVCLGSGEPAVLLLQMLHGRVKVVEELVA